MILEGLATAAVGFAAENIVGTIVGNAGEQVFHQVRREIGQVLRQGGRPVIGVYQILQIRHLI